MCIRFSHTAFSKDNIQNNEQQHIFFLFLHKPLLAIALPQLSLTIRPLI